MGKHDIWFSLHLPDTKARTMTREDYYAARSWLRRVATIMHLRYAVAHIDPTDPTVVIIPATEQVLPEKFK